MRFFEIKRLFLTLIMCFFVIFTCFLTVGRVFAASDIYGDLPSSVTYDTIKGSLSFPYSTQQYITVSTTS